MNVKNEVGNYTIRREFALGIPNHDVPADITLIAAIAFRQLEVKVMPRQMATPSGPWWKLIWVEEKPPQHKLRKFVDVDVKLAFPSASIGGYSHQDVNLRPVRQAEYDSRQCPQLTVNDRESEKKSEIRPGRGMGKVVDTPTHIDTDWFADFIEEEE